MTPSTMSPDQPALARRSDPISSHLTLASLGKDTSLKARVLSAAFALEDRHAGRPWNDTQLTEEVERATRSRQQRNVIARTRDLMTSEQLGDGTTVERWFEPTGLDRHDGRDLMHYRITAAGKVAP